MKTHSTVAALATGLALLAFAPDVRAQPAGPPAAPAARSTLSRVDTGFLRKAGEHGLAEVELGRLAEERALHAEVKAFGARMVADHGKANEELMGLAAAKGVPLPIEPDRRHRRDRAKLQKLSGPEFDRAYMKAMVADHRKEVKDFERIAKDAHDPEVREFASRQLPVLRAHLQAAQATYDLSQGSNRSGDRATGSTKR